MTFLMGYFLVVFLVFLCNSEPLPCKDCNHRKATLPEQQLRRLRYKYLKNQILKKLHLTEPPKISLPKPPLKSLLELAELTEKDMTLEIEIQPQIETTVIYPRNENLTCSEHESCLCKRFEFSIPESLMLEIFLSGEVWIYKNNLKMSRVYQIINNTDSYELNKASMGKKTRPWSKYSILTDSFWLENNLVIEVKDDKNGTQTESIVRGTNETLFLVIRSETVNGKRNTRQKRSFTCMESVESCCKENFYLNFSEIGWANWILHPEGYQANFCRGRCFNDLSNTRFFHGALLLSFVGDNEELAEDIGVSMCCTPSAMAPVTIFYRNDDGLYYQKSIDNMKVEACDCA